MKVEYFTDKAGGHRFRVVGRNGEIIVSSESYTKPYSAKRGFRRLCTLIVAFAATETA